MYFLVYALRSAFYTGPLCGYVLASCFESNGSHGYIRRFLISLPYLMVEYERLNH